MDEFYGLINILRTLRGPNGCAWDKEQTFKSLTPCIIEEAYELVDAIENENTPNIIEELGDIILQVVMICTIAEETTLFLLKDVLIDVNQKMIRRHPHVFENKKEKHIDDVLTQWDELKNNEVTYKSDMDGIPNFPALLKALKIQKRASKSGFDWPDVSGTIEKFEEEMEEFKIEVQSNEAYDKLEEEAGDVLFSLVNILRKQNINPEEALRKANKKFISRYKKMESLSQNSLVNLNLDEQSKLWEKAKTL